MSIVMNNDQSKSISMMRFLCIWDVGFDFLLCYDVICRTVLIHKVK
jgi:hypothetical protein